MKIDFKRLLISLVIPFFAGGIGTLFTFQAIPTWYATLHKPFFNPPNWLFGPVWTLLYLFQGISLYLFWNSAKSYKKKGFKLFILQTVLNALWTIIFFRHASTRCSLWRDSYFVGKYFLNDSRI